MFIHSFHRYYFTSCEYYRFYHASLDILFYFVRREHVNSPTLPRIKLLIAFFRHHHHFHRRHLFKRKQLTRGSNNPPADNILDKSNEAMILSVCVRCPRDSRR